MLHLLIRRSVFLSCCISYLEPFDILLSLDLYPPETNPAMCQRSNFIYIYIYQLYTLFTVLHIIHSWYVFFHRHFPKAYKACSNRTNLFFNTHQRFKVWEIFRLHWVYFLLAYLNLFNVCKNTAHLYVFVVIFDTIPEVFCKKQ